MNRYREIAWFAVAGTAGFAVDAGVVELTHRILGWGLVTAQIAGYLLAVTTTWLVNRHWTFVRHANADWLREWTRYVLASGVGALANNGTYLLCVLMVERMARQPVLAVAAGSLSGMVFNYLSSRHWVFRSSRD